MVFANPGIGQGIPRTRIKTANSVGSNDTDIGNTAHIEEGCRFSLRNQRPVKCGNQWRALATGGDIAPAEITNDGNTQELCQTVVVANL